MKKLTLLILMIGFIGFSQSKSELRYYERQKIKQAKAKVRKYEKMAKYISKKYEDNYKIEVLHMEWFKKKYVWDKSPENDYRNSLNEVLYYPVGISTGYYGDTKPKYFKYYIVKYKTVHEIVRTRLIQRTFK